MITTPTKDAANSGIGWSNGMAAQLNLPNMLLLPRRIYAWAEQPDARSAQIGLRTRSRRQLSHDDLLEQLGIGSAEGERTCVHTLPRQGSATFVIERWAFAAGR